MASNKSNDPIDKFVDDLQGLQRLHQKIIKQGDPTKFGSVVDTEDRLETVQRELDKMQKRFDELKKTLKSTTFADSIDRESRLEDIQNIMDKFKKAMGQGKEGFTIQFDGGVRQSQEKTRPKNEKDKPKM